MDVPFTLDEAAPEDVEIRVDEVAVQVGDHVDAGETLIRLETDKAAVDFPAPAAGRVERILVSPGDVLENGQILISILEDDEHHDVGQALTQAKESDPTLQSRYSLISRYEFALLTGAIVLFPTITGALQPPYVADLLMYFFWALGIPALLLLAVTFYLSTAVQARSFLSDGLSTTLHKVGGLGNWLSLGALICLVSYITLNLYSDRTSSPEINWVDAEPRSANLGDWVRFSGSASDEDSDRLVWEWEVDGEIVGSFREFSWRVPSDAQLGQKAVTATVSDDYGSVSATTQFTIRRDETVPQSDERQEHIRNYVSDRIKIYLARQRRGGARSTSDEDIAEILVEAASRNLESVEAIRDDPKALDEALDSYFTEIEKDPQLQISLPSCKDYPMLWPLCRPD